METSAAERGEATYGFGRVRVTRTDDAEVYELPGPRFVQVISSLGVFGAAIVILGGASVEIVEAIRDTPVFHVSFTVFSVAVVGLTLVVLFAVMVLPVWFVWRRPQRLVVGSDRVAVEGVGLRRRGRWSVPVETVESVDVFVPAGGDRGAIRAGVVLQKTACLELTAAGGSVRFGETLDPREREWIRERLDALFAGP